MSLDVYLKDPTATYETEELYSANITHNLATMADKAGIYEALWNPAEKTKAKEIIPLLEKGIEKLKAEPEYFKKYNAKNGWGVYENLISFAEKYLNACREYPEAVIHISK